MGLGGVVRVWDEVAPASSCGLHSRSDGGEGGGEVGESRRERGTGESDGEGDEFDLSPVSLESRDEGGVFLAPGFHFGVAAQIFVEADLDDDEGIEFFIEGRRV